MKLLSTRIPDVLMIEPKIHEDSRGFFMESFNEKAFHAALSATGRQQMPSFLQDNHSLSHEGVLRGLHWQEPPHAQAKLVRVVQGAVYDVAVDLRPDSKTFRQWVGVHLNDTNHRMLFIPEGFAHGFLTLASNTHFLYKTTAYYDQASERSLRFDDPVLKIQWPCCRQLKLNEKDKTAPFLV